MIENDIAYFNSEILPELNGYKIESRFFEKGDFGTLFQVSFESDLIVGSVDFWGYGWLGVDIWDLKNNVLLLNSISGPDEVEEKNESFRNFKSILRRFSISH